MLVFAVGLVTVLTFLVTYLHANTADTEDKGQYYLGLNKKRWDLYKSFWFKRFTEVPIKLFLWTLIVLPVFKLITGHYIKAEYFFNTGITLDKLFNYVDSLWVAIAIVTCAFLAALLIEAVYLSGWRFYRSRGYLSDNSIESEIEEDLERKYEKLFNRLFNLTLFFNPKRKGLSQNDFMKLTRHYVDYARERIYNREELDKYLHIFYGAEFWAMYGMYAKIKNHVDKLCGVGSLLRFPKLRSSLLKSRLENVNCYYLGKWNYLENSYLHKLSRSFFDLAATDIDRLLDFDLLFREKGEKIQEIYRSASPELRQFRSSGLPNEKHVKNECISKILEVLESALQQVDLDVLDYKEDFSRIFDQLMKVGETFGESDIYIYFYVFFYRVLELVEHETDGMNCFVKGFMSNWDLELTSARWKQCSFNKILSGNELTNKQVEFLLKFLGFDEIIIALFFRLAYRNRAQQGDMSKEEVLLWKARIRKLDAMDRELETLRENQFGDQFVNRIRQSRISHFIREEFIQWIWNSLFESFTLQKYAEFTDMRDRRVIQNFTTLDYLLFRTLITQKPWQYQHNEELTRALETETSDVIGVIEDYFLN